MAVVKTRVRFIVEMDLNNNDEECSTTERAADAIQYALDKRLSDYKPIVSVPSEERSVTTELSLQTLYDIMPVCPQCKKELYTVDTIYLARKPRQYRLALCGDNSCNVHCHCYK